MRRVALAAVLLSAAVLTQVAGAGQAAGPHVVLFVDSSGAVTTVRADGGGLHKLVSGDALYAMWAPDGTRFAYWAWASMYVVPVRGGVPREVMPGLVLQAIWSPNGRWIVAERRIGDLNRGPFPPRNPVRYALYRVHPDGSGLKRLTSWSPDGLFLQGWSPDSSRMVAVSRIALVLLDLNGRATPVPGTGYADTAAWSPDGQTIAYTRPVGLFWPGTPKGMWLVRPDGGGLRQLTAGTQSGPVWSPDGTRIAFTEIRSSDGQYVIGSVDVATGVQTSLVRDNRYVDETPSWSPDGKWLVFGRRPNVDGNKDEYLWVVNADGTRAREISHDAYGSPAAWKPQ